MKTGDTYKGPVLLGKQSLNLPFSSSVIILLVVISPK